MPLASDDGAAAVARPGVAPGDATVFVISESRLFRDALVRAVEGDARLQPAGTAPDVAAAVEEIGSLDEAPRVLLLDQPGAVDVRAVRELLDAGPGMAIVAITADDAERDVLSWVEAGAAGHVSRHASLEHLLANVAAVARGETLCSPRLAALLVDRVAALARERRGPPSGMSERLHIAAAGVDRRRPEEIGIRLLGAVGVHLAGVRLPVFPTQRAEGLFAYLVVNRDRLVHRDVLCGKFWGDQSDAQARKSLRTTLWRIRSVLEADPADRGTLVRVEGDHVGFVAPSRIWVDVWELEDDMRLADVGGDLDEPSARRLGCLPQLYRGDFMEGHYDDWCTQPREHLRAGFLAALERLVSHHRGRRDWPNAIGCAREILRHDPLREHVHRALMVSHYEMGDRPSAVRQYRRCVDVLRDQLEIEPMNETRALYDRIRAQA